jgi:MFS family permease
MSIAQPLSVDSAGRLSARAWGTLLVLCGALFLDALDVSMIGVALPSIRSDLDMSTSALQWVVSGYVLGYGGFLLLGGRAADLFGRRQVFLVSLGVFVVASGLGGLVDDGSLLIATRFIKGVAAAFTAPAGLSIITTNFAEGPARNKALLVYTATGATGFSLGLVLSGLLTEVSWRLTLLLPIPLALITLAAAIPLVPHSERPAGGSRSFDLGGAVSLTGAMLLLVFTIVQAPEEGWTSVRTLASLVGVAALLATFVAIESRSKSPLVRLGILRSGSLVRANLMALCLFGSWVGFQFIAVLYMQQLRGWSAIETGLAIFPGGLMVALLAPTLTPRLVGRFGVLPVITAGFGFAVAAFALFLPISLDSNYAVSMLPTMVLAGFAFALAYGPLNIAATNGIAPEEQGLAGGLVNTSFQVGGALFLAVTAAVISANVGTDASAQSTLDGFHAALLVPVIAAALGATIASLGLFESRRLTSAQVAPVDATPLSIPAPRALNGATIWSEDHRNLLPFYRDVLGLPVTVETPLVAVLGDHQGPTLSIGTHNDVKGRALDPFRLVVKLDSADLDADYARLRDAGVEFIDPPAQPSGLRFFTLLDPDGNVVQLSSSGSDAVGSLS